MGKKAADSRYEESRRRVALNVLRFRQALDMTQQQLADAAELDRTTLARFETQYINVTLDTVFALAEALGVAAHDLMTATDNESDETAS